MLLVHGTLEPSHRPGRPERFRGILQDVTEQEAARQALAQSAGRFRGIFENAGVGIALVSPHGTCLDVNRRLCEILDRDRDELLAGSFQQITHPEDLAANLQLVEQALAGQTEGYRMEHRYVRPDGSMAWARLTVSLVRTAAGDPSHFVSVVEEGKVVMLAGVGNKAEPYTDQDIQRVELIGGSILRIVQRRRTQARLQQFFRAIEQSPTSVPITDLVGRIEYANPIAPRN